MAGPARGSPAIEVEPDPTRLSMPRTGSSVAEMTRDLAAAGWSVGNREPCQPQTETDGSLSQTAT
jgi:hypothetical protein